MEQIDRSHFRLRSGRVVYFNQGIVGISPDLEIFEGYDGDQRGANLGDAAYGENDTELNWTPDERMEFGLYMLRLWERYAALSGTEFDEAETRRRAKEPSE